MGQGTDGVGGGGEEGTHTEGFFTAGDGGNRRAPRQRKRILMPEKPPDPWIGRLLNSGKFFIFLFNVDFYRNIFGFLLKSVDDYHK